MVPWISIPGVFRAGESGGKLSINVISKALIVIVLLVDWYRSELG